MCRFSENLLHNLKSVTGVAPKVRVGGTSHPTYFESYHTLGQVKYLHGLNTNQNSSTEQLEVSATEAGTPIGRQLHLFELGNEFNFAPGKYRSANYSLLDYVEEWNSKSAIFKSSVQSFPGLMAPSFVLLDFIDETPWTTEEVYNLGYDKYNLTKELCFHYYMGVNAPSLPPAQFNLQHQGVNGETNVFGDALRLVDFSLWAAVHGIKRLHFHQELSHRYALWQPIESNGLPPATRPPHYGQIVVTSAIGQSENTLIVNIPLSEDTESAYPIYNGDRLSKLVVTNMRAFNQTKSDRAGNTNSTCLDKIKLPGLST
ncbi:hypothetical protein N7471_002492 [Penicillium samsonianum]|uniref:uncharacterized protein n=1 Tax=Penicillium samsonianum TaxID=1882272 RepID=UPI0025465FDF|nr:uncharacterized protein N7471_002492 [Penicillium samsonianum]KAJ6143039.1 hypothetical protein N7471_002492 [Penicillium samsonianum]